MNNEEITCETIFGKSKSFPIEELIITEKGEEIGIFKKKDMEKALRREIEKARQDEREKFGKTETRCLRKVDESLGVIDTLIRNRNITPRRLITELYYLRNLIIKIQKKLIPSPPQRINERDSPSGSGVEK